MIDPALLVIGGLVLIVAVAAFANRAGVASPLLLLVAGVAAGYLPGVPPVHIPHGVIIDGVLPPLLYASAVNLPTTDFRRNIRNISGLAVVLVFVSTAITGLLLYVWFKELNLAAAIAVGAIISPTDAIAATSIAKRLGLPERLVTVLEGESLVNDATALVLLSSAVAAVQAKTSLSVAGVVGQFAYAVAVAIAVGLIVGFVTVKVRARLSDPVLTTTVSFVVPFIAYLPAERLHGSGVLATVVAGLFTGAQGARAFAATQRVSDHTNWRTVQFVLEQGVFLAMGLQFRPLLHDLERTDATLGDALWLGLLLTLVLVGVRALYVAGELPVFRWRERRLLEREHRLERAQQDLERVEPETERGAERKARAEKNLAQRRADIDFLRQNGYSWRGGAVVVWSGMRGVVTLAAAQSLPDDFKYRPLLVLIAFTVAVITLLGFGGTLPALIRRIGISGTAPEEVRDELRALVSQVRRSSLAVLDDPESVVVGGASADPRVIERLRRQFSVRGPSDDRAVRPITEDERLHEQFTVLRQRMRQAARDELLDARAIGTFTSRVITAAQDFLDLDEAREERIAEEF